MPADLSAGTPNTMPQLIASQYNKQHRRVPNTSLLIWSILAEPINPVFKFVEYGLKHYMSNPGTRPRSFNHLQLNNPGTALLDVVTDEDKKLEGL
jgi:hypothetical protein